MGEISKQFILGVEGGATKTDWALCETDGDKVQVVREGRLGSGSMVLLDDEGLINLLSVLPRDAGRVGIFLAGCATRKDHERLQALAEKIWPEAKLALGSDRESGFAAAFGREDGIAVIAGTGSAVTGRKGEMEDRAGGWGHLLGDSGGGYDLAIHALRRVLFDFDTKRAITPLAADTLRTLGLNTLRELTAWAQTAKKSDLARLTPLLFEHTGEPEVRELLRHGAEVLAKLASSVALRLELAAPKVRLMGSVFVKQPLYVELFTTALRWVCPGADVAACAKPGSLGAAFLAGELTDEPSEKVVETMAEAGLAQAATEQSNPRSENLDKMSARELVELFVNEERFVEEALRAVTAELSAAVELTSSALEAGGRLFYVGAGTSGRLGMLDASEMPPTFGVDGSLVQAILAGGVAAFQKSAEGAEDSPEGGALAVRDRGVRAGDVLCGIAASGRTPFVFGALAEARRLDARTILLTCNPQRSKNAQAAEVEIDLPTGPELITGSTRLKAGTATKVALNILTSASMVRTGRVDGNLMSCLRPTNEKLRDRASRIVASQLKIPVEEAKRRLEWANWNIRAAVNAK